MIIKSRLHIYPSKDIKDRAVIVGDRQALRELGHALIRAADNPSGYESVNMYKSNGHDYEIFVTKNIKEDEWQEMPDNPNRLSFIEDYEHLKESMKTVTKL